MKYEAFFSILNSLNKGEFVAEHRFHPVRRWRFDFASVSHKLAIEINGGVWMNGRHTRGSGFIGDMEKFNAGNLLGWHILQFTPQQVKKGEALRVILEFLNANQEGQ